MPSLSGVLEATYIRRLYSMTPIPSGLKSFGLEAGHAIIAACLLRLAPQKLSEWFPTR